VYTQHASRDRQETDYELPPEARLIIFERLLAATREILNMSRLRHSFKELVNRRCQVQAELSKGLTHLGAELDRPYPVMTHENHRGAAKTDQFLTAEE